MDFIFNCITTNVYGLLKEKKYMFVHEILGSGMEMNMDLKNLGVKSDPVTNKKLDNLRPDAKNPGKN